MKSFKKIFLMLTSFAMVVGTLLVGGSVKKTEQVEAAGATCNLVTDVSNLKIGNTYYIVSQKNNEYIFLSTTQNDNNRGQVIGDQVGTDKSTISNIPDTAQEITLGVGQDNANYSLYATNGTSTGYLCSTSTSKKNYLKTEAQLSKYSTFTITISNSVATITSLGRSDRNILQYNSSSSIFSCYNSGQTSVYLYEKEQVVTSDPYISFSRTSVELIMGHDSSFQVEYEAKNVESPTIDWTSSNLDVATVDSNGLVTPNAEGTTTITATIAGTTASASLEVSVKDFRSEVNVDNEIVIDAVNNKPDAIKTSYSDGYGVLNNCTYYFEKILEVTNQLQLKKEGASLLSNLNPYSKNIKKIVINTDGDAPTVYPVDKFALSDTTQAIAPVQSDTQNEHVYDFSTLETKNFTLKNQGTSALKINSIRIEFTEKYEIQIDEDNGNSYVEFVYDGDYIELGTPIKEGYNFAYWEDVNNNKYIAGDKFTPTGDDILVAYYTVGDILKSVNTESKLNFSYTKHVSDLVETTIRAKNENSTFEDSNITTTTMINDKSYASDGDDITKKMGFENTGLNFIYQDNSSSYHLRFNTSYIQLYSGNQINISGTNIKEIKITFSEKASTGMKIIRSADNVELFSSTTESNEISATFDATNGIAIHNTAGSQRKITSILIKFDSQVTTYSGFNNMVMGFGATIPTDVLTAFGGVNAISSAGILVEKVESETADFNQNIVTGMNSADLTALDTDGSNIMLIPLASDSFASVNGGIRVDGFINYPNPTDSNFAQSWNTLVKATVYVIVDGKAYFATAQTFSVKTKLEAYLSNPDITLSTEQRNVIDALLKDNSIWGK